jgi:enoyl-CoA hydratase/carnithine racemase
MCLKNRELSDENRPMTAEVPGAPVQTTFGPAGDARVATIVLNRPHAGNAITVELADGLDEALRAAARQARVIVIRGAGGTFCAGGDFGEVARLRAEGPEALRRLFEAFIGACELIADLPVPVVAAVEGYAMAGGFELIQACDIAIARDDAVLADNHLNFGMIPAGGGSQRLPRIVGPQRGLGLILTGGRLTGAEAMQWGLVYRSVPPEEFEQAVAEVVTNLAAKDATALASAKHLVREGLRRPLQDGLAMETQTAIEHLYTSSADAGLSRFSGAGPASSPTTRESP